MLKTLKYFTVVIIPFLFLHCTSKPTKEDVLNNFNRSTKNLSSTQYTVDYTHKSFSQKDTLKLKALCWIEKSVDDSLLGMKVKMLHESGFIRFYDGKNYYTIDNEKLLVKVEDPLVSNVMPFVGSVWDDLIFKELIDGVPVKKLNEFKITYEFEDNPYGNTDYILKFLLPDSGEFTGVLKLWVDKKTYLPQKMISEYYFQGNTQYSEISISDLIINDNRVSEVFNNFKIPDGYTTEYYSPFTTKENNLLPNNSKAPKFSLENQFGKEYALDSLKGKVVIIDFWYTTCYPCIKAMPFLEDLYQKYEEKGLVVLGVNPIDTLDMEKLNDFLTENKVSYPILIGNKDIVNNYSIHAYPSLYLIDQNGNIIFSEIGFNENTAIKLDSLIELNLKEK